MDVAGGLLRRVWGWHGGRPADRLEPRAAQPRRHGRPGADAHAHPPPSAPRCERWRAHERAARRRGKPAGCRSGGAARCDSERAPSPGQRGPGAAGAPRLGAGVSEPSVARRHGSRPSLGCSEASAGKSRRPGAARPDKSRAARLHPHRSAHQPGGLPCCSAGLPGPARCRGPWPKSHPHLRVLPPSVKH